MEEKLMDLQRGPNMTPILPSPLTDQVRSLVEVKCPFTWRKDKNESGPNRKK